VEALKPIKRFGIGLIGLSALLMSSGCITLLPKPGKPPTIVTMRADPALTRAATPAAFSMGVGFPVMPAILATNKIAVRTEGGSYAFVDRLILSASAPDTIQNVVLETFDRAGAAKAAVRALTVARPDYELHFDVNAFEVTEPDGRRPGVARVEAGVRLVEVSTGKPLASTVILSEVPAPRGDRTVPARALEEATRKMALEAMNWSIRTATPLYASKAASATR
jgi:cholesterol transport system auxiliary component